MTSAIDYILRFLVYGNEEAVGRIGYTADKTQWGRYSVVIVPNGHIGKDWVYPNLGTPVTEGNIIRTDIVYNTLFFLSRAEELINPQRDAHGRFLAEYSVLGQPNRLQIPLIDEYSRLLMKKIGLSLPPAGFGRICLTHDIDTIAHYRHLRGAIGGVVRGQWREVLASWRNIENDPAYTFPWLMRQDDRLPNAEKIYFVKHTRGRGLDYPQYNLSGRDCRQLLAWLQSRHAQLGLHSSCYGTLPRPIPYSIHRSHYLNCSIGQMRQLAEAGVTDDYTMGFPDRAGFRLQTTRPARWIDPDTLEVTTLTLHPLTVMDCTLSNTGYMNLDENEAFFLCERLFAKVRQYRGELVLLWHNNNIRKETYHKTLYPKLIGLIEN